ncbi:hypothetical protein NC651_002096 [Populus alba x Populus x berolinensis]|nr:hypothetical protein NC651_002096 [Populus alba x Populus x berolinensis]
MSPTESSREENVYMAKLAEQAERYEEMVEFMEKVAKTIDNEELTMEERNLLSVAYKNVIGARRASWRIISSIEQKEESRGNEDHVTIIKEYRGKIEAELCKICDGILSLLETHLVPSASAAESKVFYLKMKGDYHRYLAEFKTGAERKEAAESTLLSYKSAQDIALSELAPTHPIRLGLALNFSVYYEILNSPDRACSLAKQAHPNHDKFLNKKLDMYEAMIIVVGKDMATGNYAKSYADVNLEESTEEHSISIENEGEYEETYKGKETSSSSTQKRQHRKRNRMYKDDGIKKLSKQIGNVAFAIQSLSKNQLDVNALYTEVMKIEGFDEITLGDAFDHLVQNEMLAKAFMAKNANLRKIWVQNFVNQHYYMPACYDSLTIFKI